MSTYGEHVERALDNYSGHDSSEAAEYALDRQTHAILALADQLRIANLIALGVIGGGPISNNPTDLVERWLSRQYPDIADALGIKETTNE